MSRLTEASLRINESLDFDTALKGALDPARAFTQARCGVITPLDGAGWLQDFLPSGFHPEATKRLWDLPQ